MKKKAVILGAGISGLSVWQTLSKEFNITLLEKNPFVGGLCASFRHEGYILDYGPHKLYSQLPGIMDEFKDILGEECLKVKKKNSLRLLNKYFEFPLKIKQLIKNISPRTIAAGMGLGFGYLFSLLRNILRKRKNVTYEDYFVNGFGKKGYEVLFRDLAWKVWGNPKLLTEELARRRIPIPSISGLIKSVFSKKEGEKVSAEYFYYPKKGIGELCNKISSKIREKGTIFLESIPTSIDVEDNIVKSVTCSHRGESKKIDTDLLISTIPIKELPHLIKPLPPKEILDAAQKLKYRALLLVYLIIDKPRLMDDIWVFFLDKEVMFNRISEQKGFSKFTVPEGKTVITIEVTAETDDAIWNYPAKQLIEVVIKDLKKVGILKDERIIDSFVKRVKNAYPLYSIDYKENLKKILDYVDKIPNLFSIGRHGMFNYNNMDHCMDMAHITAKHILNKKTKEEWKQKRKYFDSYRIVD